MNNLVCCASIHSIGCTFLDWTLHFLSGNKLYPRMDGSFINLSNNPIELLNAHGHQKNHPRGSVATSQAADILLQHNGLTSLYPVPLSFIDSKKSCGITTQHINKQDLARIKQHQAKDYNLMLNNLDAIGAKIIFVDLNKNYTVYRRSLRDYSVTLDTVKLANEEQLYQEHDKIFFSDSVKTWNDYGLNEIWDIRERRALSVNLSDDGDFAIDLSVNHYYLNCCNWWHNGIDEIQKIMSWAGITINYSRFNSWKTIYYQWQEIIHKQLQFQWNYQHIVDSIVNNWSMPIDLTFDQEVIIQHCLIYNHNLNLKTWQLTKFPSNTQDLHKLLEPNIHPL